MAQAGFTPISLYHSTTPAATPIAGNLVAGELAINIADGILFYKDSAGVVQEFSSGGGAAGGAIITNTTTISENYTFPAGINGVSVGPITIQSGFAVTVASGRRWVVL